MKFDLWFEKRYEKSQLHGSSYQLVYDASLEAWNRAIEEAYKTCVNIPQNLNNAGACAIKIHALKVKDN